MSGRADAADVAEDIHRALREATAFGTRKIIEAFEEAGLPVNQLLIAGASS